MAQETQPPNGRPRHNPIARSRGMRLPADVTFTTTVRDGFRDLEATIGAERLARLAAAGCVPPELQGALREHARLLVIGLSVEMRDLSVQRTRSQLRHELIDLLRSLRTNGDLPVIPPWLRSEIEGYFIRFRLDLPFGKAPTITICEAEDQYRKSEEARSEVLASLNDHDKLQDVVESVLGFLKRSPPYTREFVASKSSMRPELEIIFRWIESFWFGTLRRPPKLSVELQAFSDEIFKMCGVDVPGLSLVRRLQAMIRTAAAGSTA